MNLEEYAGYDGLGLAKLIKDKEIAPHELAKLAAQAVAEVNPALNAVLEVFEDRFEPQGHQPFDTDSAFGGVPYLLKDLGSSEKGRKQEMGSLLFQGHVASETGFLIERFQKVGLNSVGRAAVPEFGMSCSTDSPAHGITRSPWDTDRTPGGSSGGSCAMIAAGAVPIAHTSDLGGSTRLPASCSGVVGLKPTRGRVTLGPDHNDMPIGTLSEFVATRTVRDCAAMLDAVEGPWRNEVRTVQSPVRPFLEELDREPRKLRVAICTESLLDLPVDAEVKATIEAVGKTLEGMGHVVSHDYYRFDYEEFQEHDGNLTAALVSTAFEHFRAGMDDLDESKLDNVSAWLVERGRAISGQDVFNAFEAYNAMRADIYGFFSRYDLLLTPTITMLPEILPVANTYKDWDRYCQYLIPVSVAGNPGLSLPLGMSQNGLPIGVQLVTPFGDEATMFRVARALEIAMPWADRRPAVHVTNGK